AAGVTWGVGTIILLFYNGVILGAVSADYVGAGYGQFLAGWLLPHGAIEIPAILLGGQGGLVLASALIGWGERATRAERLRAVAHDLLAIALGAAAMLVWAGIVEAFVSQYHQPLLPYSLKIAFGILEIAALTIFLWRVGRT
ncbi:MAG: stage II sporulation protein M, partial [Bryobacteraceae bacterium]